MCLFSVVRLARLAEMAIEREREREHVSVRAPHTICTALECQMEEDVRDAHLGASRFGTYSTVLRYEYTSMDLCLALGEGQDVSWNLDLGGDP